VKKVDRGLSEGSGILFIFPGKSRSIRALIKMKVVIIGNGIGGFSAASTLRHLDHQCDITMISNETSPLYSACALPGEGYRRARLI